MRTPAKRVAHLLLALTVLLSAGCLSVSNLTDHDGNRRVLGGVRTGVDWLVHPDLSAPDVLFLLFDMPCSLVADTAFLPLMPVLATWDSAPTTQPKPPKPRISRRAYRYTGGLEEDDTRWTADSEWTTVWDDVAQRE